MSKHKFPVTAAVRVLRQHKAVFSNHLYDYQGGGAVEGAQSLRVDPFLVIKTLIMENEGCHPLDARFWFVGNVAKTHKQTTF